MIDIAIEVGTNLFQSFMFVGFLFLFLERNENKTINILAFSAFVTILFLSLNYFSFYGSYDMDYLNTFLSIIILEVYSIAFLKGNIKIRIVVPVILFVINIAISYAFAYYVSYFTKIAYSELATESSVYRFMCIVVINITCLIFYFIILKFKRNNMLLTNTADFISFVLIPIVTLVIIYSTFSIITITNFRSDILPFLVIICAGMIIVSIMVWLMMSRIIKNNEIKTKLLLMEQKEELYKNDILNTNSQIKEMSKIKHDMKNNLLCIDGLICEKKYSEAQGLCSEISHNLNKIYTPISTNNPLLNAVVNVELEKATAKGIDMVAMINSTLPDFRNNADIVSIIGNLCDNAIEYLENCDEEFKSMKLEITEHNDYYIIICSNKITSSILDNNPNLTTSKSDKKYHGKGIYILKSKVKKYSGELKHYEKDDWFYAAVVLKMLTIPEKR